MIFVESTSSNVVCSGLTFTVFGGFFDSGCYVKFGDVVAVVESFSNDRLTVVVSFHLADVNVLADDLR